MPAVTHDVLGMWGHDSVLTMCCLPGRSSLAIPADLRDVRHQPLPVHHGSARMTSSTVGRRQPLMRSSPWPRPPGSESPFPLRHCEQCPKCVGVSRHRIGWHRIRWHLICRCLINDLVDQTRGANGRFASLSDPEGNLIQLWQPAGADLRGVDEPSMSP